MQQRELGYSRRKYPRRRKSNPTLFLVEEDRRYRTQKCADFLEEEFYHCVDVEITRDDDDADRGDYVVYLDRKTDCDDAEEWIEDVLGCKSGYRRYKYGKKVKKYRFYKDRWWNRYHRRSKKSKKDDDDDDDKPRRYKLWKKQWW